MGKTLAIVGEVVAIAAVGLVTAGIGSALLTGASLGAAISGVGLASIAGITAPELFLASSVIGIAASLTAPKVGQTAAGTQVDWQADPTAPVPYLIGRTGTSGTIALQDVSGNKNSYLWTTTVYSGCGPVRSIGGFTANDVAVSFTADGGEGAGAGSPTTSLTQDVPSGAKVLPVASVQNFAAGQTITVGGESVVIDSVYSIGSEFSLKSALGQAHGANTTVTGPSNTSFYQNRLWWKPILGSQAGQFVTFTNTGSKDTPANHSGIPPTWTGGCTMHGLAGSIMACEYDTAKYPTGVIKPQVVVEGVSAYDPRQDSTYQGGSGPCRLGDESTWVYSQNPFIHALTWLIGRKSNGKPTMGLHAPISAIDVAAFVEGANVADSHGWTLGGVIYSTDGKRDVLRSMLRAGSGEPIPLGAKISCLVDAPKVSLDTITGADVVGDVSIAAIQSARTAPNTIWPRYREEAQGWQIVPTAAPIQVTAYFAHDGGQRSKEVEYTLCQSADQAATLARYDIENGREFGPITLPCKPRWMGFRPGDAITVNEPEYGLNGQKCLILNRSVDPGTMICTLTLRSETDGKHAFALGETADPPPIPGLTGVDLFNVPPPAPGSWSITDNKISGDGGVLPAIVVTGAVDNPNASAVILDHRAIDGPEDDWTSEEWPASTTQLVSTSVAAGRTYEVAVRYRTVRDVEDPETGLELGEIQTADVTAKTATTAASVTHIGDQEINDFIAAFNAAVAKADAAVATAASAVEATGFAPDQNALTLIQKTISTTDLAIVNDALNRSPATGETINKVVDSHTTVLDDHTVKFGAIIRRNAAGTGYLFDMDTLAVDDAGTTVAGRVTLISAATGTSVLAQVADKYVTSTSSAQALAAATQTVTAQYKDFVADAVSTKISYADATQAIAEAKESAIATAAGNTASATSLLASQADLTGAIALARTEISAETDGKVATATSTMVTQTDQQQALAGLDTELRAFVNNGVGATVSQQAGVLADLNGRTLAFLQFTATAGAGSARVRIVADDGSTSVQMDGQDIYFGPNVSVETATATQHWLAGGVQNVVGAGFGANGDLLEWFGPASIATAQMTTANAYVYRSTAGVEGGPGLPSAGGGAHAVTVQGTPTYTVGSTLEIDIPCSGSGTVFFGFNMFNASAATTGGFAVYVNGQLKLQGTWTSSGTETGGGAYPYEVIMNATATALAFASASGGSVRVAFLTSAGTSCSGQIDASATFQPST